MRLAEDENFEAEDTKKSITQLEIELSCLNSSVEETTSRSSNSILASVVSPSASASVRDFVERVFFQRWIITFAHFLVFIISVAVGIAQFSNLVDKALFCENVRSFDVPSSEEVNHLKGASECLAPPGLYNLGEAITGIISERELFLVSVE